MKATDIDFDTIENFTIGEFPETSTDAGNMSVLEFTDADTIRAISRFRDLLGHAVVPSPLTAGWIREGDSQSSQHHIGPISQGSDGALESQRLSTAGDVFPYCDARLAFTLARSMTEFGGVGIYLDTNGPSGHPQPMLHLDTRSGRRQVWMRFEGRYIYPERGGGALREFYSRLGEM